MVSQGVVLLFSMVLLSSFSLALLHVKQCKRDYPIKKKLIINRFVLLIKSLRDIRLCIDKK